EDTDIHGCAYYPTEGGWGCAPLVGDGKVHMDVEEETAAALAVRQQSQSRIIEIEMVVDFGSPPSPGSPYSPRSPGSPSSTQDTPSGLHKMPQSDIYQSDTEDEEDPYFNSLVDNFIGEANCTGLLTSSPEIDYVAASQRQSLLYAESALKHYNNNDENKLSPAVPSNN
ncbi:hypothetical protein E2562_009878, partial [Oryza meyeriana var. granulata]